jgi:hypothetical protein
MSKRRWKIEDIKEVMEGQNPFKQWGYDSIQPYKRKIGERWVDGRGKTWEQRDGYKVVVNEKADSIRDLLRQTCSLCKKDMRWGNRLDKQFFKKSGMCYDCTINHDTILMANGEWDLYEKKKVLSYQLSYIKDVRQYVKESIDYLSSTDGKMRFVDEMGGMETWTNTQIDVLLSGAKNDYEKLTRDMEDTEKMIASLER